MMAAELVIEHRNAMVYNYASRIFFGIPDKINPYSSISYFNTLLLNCYLASGKINSVKIIDAFWENICQRATAESNLEKRVNGPARN